MDLSEKLDSNKMSAVQSFDMIVRSALIDHEDRIKKMEKAALERGGSHDKESEEWMNAPMGMSAPTSPTVERFVMWGGISTNWNNPMVGLRGVTQRKNGEVVATKVTDEDSTFNRWDWQIIFSGEIVGMFLQDKEYQLLKRNGCFGEQVK